MSITLTDGSKVVNYPFPLHNGQIALIQLSANETFPYRLGKETT